MKHLLIAACFALAVIVGLPKAQAANPYDGTWNGRMDCEDSWATFGRFPVSNGKFEIGYDSPTSSFRISGSFDENGKFRMKGRFGEGGTINYKGEAELLSVGGTFWMHDSGWGSRQCKLALSRVGYSTSTTSGRNIYCADDKLKVVSRKWWKLVLAPLRAG